MTTSRVWQDTQSYIRPQPVKVTRRQQLEEGWAGRRRLGQMLWPRRFGRPSPCSRCTWTPSSAWKGGWSWSWLPNSTDFFIGFLFRCCQLMPDQISDWSARWRPGRWWPRPWWLSDICYSPKKKWKPFLEAWKSDILVLVAPAVKGAGPRLKAGVDLKVFPELPLDDGEGGAAATLQVLLRMVSRLCVWAKFMLSKFFVILALQSAAISTSEN